MAIAEGCAFEILFLIRWVSNSLDKIEKSRPVSLIEWLFAFDHDCGISSPEAACVTHALTGSLFGKLENGSRGVERSLQGTIHELKLVEFTRLWFPAGANMWTNPSSNNLRVYELAQSNVVVVVVVYLTLLCDEVERTNWVQTTQTVSILLYTGPHRLLVLKFRLVFTLFRFALGSRSSPYKNSNVYTTACSCVHLANRLNQLISLPTKQTWELYWAALASRKWRQTQRPSTESISNGLLCVR